MTLLTPNIATCFNPQRITIIEQVAYNIAWNLLKYCQARSRCFTKRLLASCPSVRLSVRPLVHSPFIHIEQLRSNWNDFYEIWYLSIFGKSVRGRQATDDSMIRRMRIACWITKATDTLRICIAYCFSTFSKGFLMRFVVTWYVYCLSCDT
jgi:hypothetical protein